MMTFSMLRRSPLLATLTLIAFMGGLLPPRPARADDGPSPAPPMSQGAGASSLGESSTGAQAARGATVSVNGSTGSMTTAVRFDLMKARGRVQPSLSLVYSSTGGLGVGGWGWQLAGPMTIERRQLAGPPVYKDPAPDAKSWDASEDDFYLNGVRLVPVCKAQNSSVFCGGILTTTGKTVDAPVFPDTVIGWWYFVPENDASHLRAFWSPNHQTWVIQDKGGNTYELGKPLDSSDAGALDLDASAPGSPPYRWNVARAYDTQVGISGSHNNRVLYRWSKLDGTLANPGYLTDIYDTPQVSAATMDDGSPEDLLAYGHHTQLTYAPSPTVSWAQTPTWRSTPKMVLQAVNVSSAGKTWRREQVRGYKLSYHAYRNRALLDTVTTTGRCDSTSAAQPYEAAASPCTIPSLPPQKFTYYEPSDDPKVVPLGAVPNGSMLLDFNSDGLADFVGTSADLPHSWYGDIDAVALNIHGQSLQSTQKIDSVNITPPRIWIFPGSNGLPANFLGDAHINLAYGCPAGAIGGNDRGANVGTDFYAPNESYCGIPYPHLSPDLEHSCDAVYTPVYAFNSIAWLSNQTPPSVPLNPSIGTNKNENTPYINAEGVLDYVDVDGDGYLDAVTDTISGQYWAGTRLIGWGTCPQGSTGTWPQLARKDDVHLVGLRLTRKNHDGTLRSFQDIPANTAVDHTFPSVPGLTAPGASYVARVDDSKTPFAPLFRTTSPDNPLQLFADMNGDGLVDWVVYKANGTISYWPGHGNGVFGLCASGNEPCSPEEHFAHPVVMNASLLTAKNAVGAVPNDPFAFQDAGLCTMLDTCPHPVPIPLPPVPPAHVAIHDVSGDGLADVLFVDSTGLTLFESVDGHSFSAPQTFDKSRFPAGFFDNPTKVWIQFGDMNGSGVEDIVLLAANDSGTQAAYLDLIPETPALMRQIDNGLGASTSIEYTTSALIPTDQNGFGLYMSPQIVHPVQATVTWTNVPGEVSQRTQYSYANPVYDPRDRSFAGFQQVTQWSGGQTPDPSDPPVSTTTTYLVGKCEVDGAVGGSGNCSSYPATSADRPYHVLRGLPAVEVTRDDAGHVYSSRVHTYKVIAVATGQDNSVARFAYPEKTQTALYELDRRAPPPRQDREIVTVAEFSDSSGQPHAFRPVNYAAVTQQTMTVDTNGNVLESIDFGRIPPGSSDTAIHTVNTWYLPPGDRTGWAYRKHTVHVDPVSVTGTPFPDQPIDQTLDYDADGNLFTITARLTGTQPLNRHHEDAAQQTAPAPPTISSEGSLIQTRGLSYDQWGNPTEVRGANGTSCTRIAYEANFAQLPVQKSSFLDGCPPPGVTDAPALVTTYTPYRAVQLVAMTTGPDGSTTTQDYDGFGRPTTTYAPDPAHLGQTIKIAATFYFDIAGGPLQKAVRYTFDESGSTATEDWSITDPLGRPFASIHRADASSGDDQNWIVSGRAVLSPHGHVERAYAPYFATVDPFAFDPASVPTSASTTATYDALGRPLTRRDVDGTQTAAFVYHVMSVDMYDGEQLNAASPHYGSFTTIVHDGHGRVIRTKNTRKSDTIITDTTYGASGKPLVVTQSHLANLAESVSTYAAFDSLGRRVATIEPNSTIQGGFWVYAYDDAGRLVATSDPRGCGENLAYDAAGRVLSEDYSPCRANQTPYTAPSTAGDGTEAFYDYDAPPGTTTTIGHGLLPDGHLYRVRDRAEDVTTSRDVRGRITSIKKRIALPGAPSAALSSRYAPTVYRSDVTYDNLDRETSRSTGADVAALLSASTHDSIVRTSYSRRGTVASIDSSYGTLVAKEVLEADGLPRSILYGDAGKTMASYTYDARRRTQSFTLARTQGNAATLGSGPTADEPTQQSVFEKEIFGYDAANNPTSIVDGRIDGEWRAGSMPVDKTITYDDDYRVTDVKYADHGGADVFVPFTPAASPTFSPLPNVAAGGHRIADETFAFDWLGNLTSGRDDTHTTMFSRSVGTVSTDPIGTFAKRLGATKLGPHQFHGIVDDYSSYDHDGVQPQYDEAGNLVALAVMRIPAFCSDTSGKCSHLFFYDWDEVGHLARARRWDFIADFPKFQNDLPTNYDYPTKVPAFAAAVDVSFAYDAQGQRALRAASHPAATTSSSPVYTATIFGSLRLENTRWDDASGDYVRDESTESVYLIAGGTSLGRVVYNPALPTAKEGVAQHVFLEFAESLGSTSALIDYATSELVERRTYQAYGQTESDYRPARWSAFRDAYGFTGQEPDDETGLVYFGARYYAPQIGRFISPDPVYIAGDARLNPYVYVNGRVSTLVDPTGLDPWCGTLPSGWNFCATPEPGPAYGSPYDPTPGDAPFPGECAVGGCGEELRQQIALADQATLNTGLAGSNAAAAMDIWQSALDMYWDTASDAGMILPAALWEAGHDLFSTSGTSATPFWTAVDMREAEIFDQLAHNLDRGMADMRSGRAMPMAGPLAVGETLAAEGLEGAANAAAQAMSREPWAWEGMGNITHAGGLEVGDALKAGEAWVGPGYKEVYPGVFRSADELRQFRMMTEDITGAHGPIGPHVHFEALDPLGGGIENLHVPLIGAP